MTAPAAVDLDALERELLQQQQQQDQQPFPPTSTTPPNDTGGGAYFLARDSQRALRLSGPAVSTCDNGHDHTVFDEQRALRRQLSSSRLETRGRAALHHAGESLRDAVLDLYAASKIFGIHLVTFESLFVVASSLLATTGYYLYSEHRRDGKAFGANISWMIVSFAIVAPMIMQIKQAFTRRELALDVLAESKSLFANIMLANALWNWGDNGRSKLPAGHAARTKALLVAVLRDICSLLLLPTLTRGRHRLTVHGRQVASRYEPTVEELQTQLMLSFKRLHEQVEVMKAEGLPANEASRINQYHWLLQARLEKLQNIKFYRTPQATRSFTRLFILVLPVFYGPYYVYLMRGDEFQSTSFAFCLVLSVVTSLTMIGIFNVEIAMEDPFAGGGMDGIRVRETFELVHDMLDVCYSDKRTDAV
ncbi:hypothetical protein PybrP1_003300 [[Pythium] brassicae (nom. inval.)]|nr:hypothetical protein PybrP1_003300 [[Pythium] brassicae (nom. inval.)]